MIELTDEQRRQLESGQAVAVTDSQTSQAYVLLREDVYDRVRQVLWQDSDWTAEELRAQLSRSAESNGWNEPAMDAYDRRAESR